MNGEQKLQVKGALLRYITCFPTQAEASEKLDGITPTLISQVKHEHWDNISDHTWQNLAKQVGFFCGEWYAAETSTWLLLRILFSDSMHYTMAYGIAIGSGLGKTFTACNYVREHKNVFYLAGNENHNRHTFMQSLMQAGDLDTEGTTPVLLEKFKNYISSVDEPLIIADDAHLLKDRVLHLLVALTNMLGGVAGIIIMGRDELRTRITDGVRLKKKGFDQVYQTFGKRFITMGKLGPHDIEVICNANGLVDENIINHISEECNGSLHNITHLVERYKPLSIAA